MFCFAFSFIRALRLPAPSPRLPSRMIGLRSWSGESCSVPSSVWLGYLLVLVRFGSRSKAIIYGKRFPSQWRDFTNPEI